MRASNETRSPRRTAGKEGGRDATSVPSLRPRGGESRRLTEEAISSSDSFREKKNNHYRGWWLEKVIQKKVSLSSSSEGWKEIFS